MANKILKNDVKMKKKKILLILLKDSGGSDMTTRYWGLITVLVVAVVLIKSVVISSSYQRHCLSLTSQARTRTLFAIPFMTLIAFISIFLCAC